MSGKGFWIVLAVILIGFIGVITYTKKDKAAESGSTASSQGSQNYYGKMDSPVTITEFVDFQCEACYAYYPYVKQVKEIYKDKVRFQVRNFPITSGHQFAFQAARSAEAAARQGKFWEMHDKIFEGQKQWEQTQNPQSYFDQYAEDIGLDMEKYRTDRDSSDVAAVINKDLADVKEIGGTGTPTFAINGVKVDKTEPSVEGLSKMIDDALANQGGSNE
ncbi:MAG: DsbA family protein [Candidatus Saccharibacteria bacterium]|nr:DsbA family protein [Candidatus Saccharibacteria bacterium]